MIFVLRWPPARTLMACLALLPGAFGARGDEGIPADGQYHLNTLDRVKLAVQGEPDLTVERRIDGLGNFDVPLLGPVKLAGLTTAEAQIQIAKRYVDGEIFIHPEVVVSIVDYSPQLAVVLGQVTHVGPVTFPPEASKMTIVAAIGLAGGFTEIANTSSVRVTRKDADGHEQTLSVDVGKMIDGRHSRADGDLFEVQPGDVVFVPERRF